MFKNFLARLTGSKTPGQKTAKPNFAAVEIRTKLGEHCAAVQALEGERFLSVDAPTIPVAGCTNPGCGCHYVYHTDRRDEPRREQDVGLSRNPPIDEDDNKRSGTRGRRQND